MLCALQITLNFRDALPANTEHRTVNQTQHNKSTYMHQ